MSDLRWIIRVLSTEYWRAGLLDSCRGNDGMRQAALLGARVDSVMWAQKKPGPKARLSEV